jgi:hypothetical protein
MLIQCTKKLLDQLNLVPQPTGGTPSLFSWHAHLITLKRRKCIVLMNDSNQYVLVLYGLKAKDFKQLDRLISEAIREHFRAEYVSEEVIQEYLGERPEWVYGKTKDRSMVARLNKACAEVEFYAGRTGLDSERINQPRLGRRVSGSLAGAGKGSYIRPFEVLYQDLEKLCQGPVIDCPAAQLKVTLDLENHSVWRRLVVPAAVSFRALHDILQRTFGWQDCHLHDFMIMTDGQPQVNLVCDEDCFEYEEDIPMILDTGKKLTDYLPDCSEIIYTYDFGDNWKHTILVEELISSYKLSYPQCLAGEGNTPPEDVGGEGGYDEFLEAISDPRHPEHQEMMDWGKMQRYADFDMDMVNWRLRMLR